MGPGPWPMGPGPSEEVFVGYQQLRGGSKGPRVTHSLGPRAAGGSPSAFPNLPSSFDPFPSRLSTSWFVGIADGINNAEVVMMVGGYDGGFGARVG